ncbi:YhbD family protein [Haloimpatiens sp. FM7330]|uniref:YhbD family protein n=1 Tax=Haloimpatiens sp. FM7330 TaxID=3298610 RepID=UPI003635F24F
MEENLISKKELLSITGISYGQLYRWKRKKLIPEEWFIKKSSFTGQETFFPKDKILDRINKIKNMKDDLSLDEIANMFAPNLEQIFLRKDEVIERNIVTEMTINIYLSIYENEQIFSFEKILFMYVLEVFMKSGEVGLEEGKNILTTLSNNYKKYKDNNYDVILIRKFGAAVCMLVSVPNSIYIEEHAKLVLKVNIVKCVEELKMKLLGNKY